MYLQYSLIETLVLVIVAFFLQTMSHDVMNLYFDFICCYIIFILKLFETHVLMVSFIWYRTFC
jgi:hypothetical protein